MDADRRREQVALALHQSAAVLAIYNGEDARVLDQNADAMAAACAQAAEANPAYAAVLDDIFRPLTLTEQRQRILALEVIARQRLKRSDDA